MGRTAFCLSPQLGSLVPLEPRLAKKLVEPLTEIITTTPAKSLLYECVNTLLSGMHELCRAWSLRDVCTDAGKITSKEVVRLCLDKLKTFIENPDQNRNVHFPCIWTRLTVLCSLFAVKYLGLLGLHKLMKSFPRVVAG